MDTWVTATIKHEHAWTKSVPGIPQTLLFFLLKQLETGRSASGYHRTICNDGESSTCFLRRRRSGLTLGLMLRSVEPRHDSRPYVLVSS